jgi:hypothetical protein
VVRAVIDDVTASARSTDALVRRRAWNGLLCFDELELEPVPVSHDLCVGTIHFNHYMTTGWPEQGPPHPGLFIDYFFRLLNALTNPNERVTIWVHAVDRQYFDELEFIAATQAKMRLPYMLLPMSPEMRTETGPLGHLFFESMVSDLEEVISTDWLNEAPQVEIEGYVSFETILPRIARAFFAPPTEARIVDVLEQARFAFRVWPDGNGLTFASITSDLQHFRRKLDSSSLSAEVSSAAGRYHT